MCYEPGNYIDDEEDYDLDLNASVDDDEDDCMDDSDDDDDDNAEDEVTPTTVGKPWASLLTSPKAVKKVIGEGTWHTCNYAQVTLKHVQPHSVVLNTTGYYFNHEAIGELIEFLGEVRSQMTPVIPF